MMRLMGRTALVAEHMEPDLLSGNRASANEKGYQRVAPQAIHDLNSKEWPCQLQ
jgi:hypothetical protein